MNYSSFNKYIQSDAIQALIDKKSDGTFREFLDDWKWIFSFSARYKGIIVFYTVLGLLGSSLSLVSAWISRLLINIVVGKEREQLGLLVGLMLGSTVFNLILGSISSRINTKISIYVNNDIQSHIFEHILDARWKELSRYPSGDLLNRFNNDVGTIAGNAIGWIPNLVINIYSFVITFVVLFRLDPVMAWIAILSAPFLLAMSRRIMRRQKEYRRRVLELNSGMMSFEVETFFNFDMIKSFGVFGYYGRKLKEWQKKYRDYSLDYNMFHIKTNILLTAVGTAVSMAAFGYCLFRLWTGQILYGDMTFFLQQRGSLSNRFNSLVGTIPGMLNSAISAHRVRELMDLPREKHDPESCERMKAPAEQGLAVKLKDISFAYQSGEKAEGEPPAGVYEHASFSASPGEIVAILAPSGGGKTTFMRLLLGMLEPDRGAVVLQTRDGEEMPVNADLRLFFSYVPQGNTVLSGTIAENMRMVREDVTDDEIVAALKTACAWEFVEKMGIDAKIGERGRGISEGQAQRLAIARALVRNSPILLLDEATSALDIDTEERVLSNIIKSDPSKVIIVSTHRPSVLKLCDRVYRVRDGKIEQTSLSDVRREELQTPERRPLRVEASIPDLSESEKPRGVDWWEL